MGQMTATDDEMFAFEVLGASLWHGPWSILGNIRCPVLLLLGELEDVRLASVAQAVARAREHLVEHSVMAAGGNHPPDAGGETRVALTGRLRSPAAWADAASYTMADLGMLRFAFAFAIKMPLFPLHTWLPAAYVSSPVPVLIVFAGLVSKLGAYGFIRFNLALFPSAAHSLSPFFAVLATIGILYGAFMALAQTDLKRLVAYASMSHLGFIGLGIFTGNLLGIEGALVQMINHGVIIAALFLVVGMIERRSGTRLRGELRGLGANAPLFAALFLVVSLAALGLPGLNGFVGEFLVLSGTFLTHRPLAAVATMRHSPGKPRPATAVAIASPPENQVADGGAASVASRRSSFSRAAASAFSNAALYALPARSLRRSQASAQA